MKNQGAVLCIQEDIPNIEGMLFVRITDILIRMVKAPLIAIGLLLTVVLPAQSFGSLRAVDFTIYPDGTTHISQQSSADPTEPELKVPLFGKSIDNFVVQDEDGLLLSFDIDSKGATIQTFGASSVTVAYDSYDLVSKKGKIWTFAVDSPVDYTVTMPDESTVVDIANPDNIDSINEKQLSLLKGKNQIEYFFSTSGPALSALNAINDAKTLVAEAATQGIDVNAVQEKLDLAVFAYDNKKYTDAEDLALEANALALQKIDEHKTNQPTENPVNWLKDNVVGIATSIVAIGGAVTTLTLILKKTKGAVQKTIKPLLNNKDEDSEPEPEVDADELVTQEMREDDKQLVSYLEKNGGQAFERDLRKKFLLPRTTMWRAVKRLERQGIIEIEKKDFQNLVRLRKKEESQQ
ncbi:helix-turn-helix transcriptional regulator [Candidatus Nitrosotenuis cloacae]|uniref:helix-turn-helix transcriptional regulator n=1 Tax=Candidatus Nitrosotenuis cloacae TaxID=1603555 RepID=UPI0006992CBD|nr:MarR family transcriptional regulator [Candidatus Nitrosotenuis cloacae]